jgi:hypothetical protein
VPKSIGYLMCGFPVRWKTIGWAPLEFLVILQTGQFFEMNEGLEEVLGFQIHRPQPLHSGRCPGHPDRVPPSRPSSLSSALLSFTEIYVMAWPSSENANAFISWRLSVIETELRS